MGSSGWGWLSKGQVSRTRGALMPRTEAEGPVSASSQPHSPPPPPPSSLIASAAPPACHILECPEGLAQDVISTIGQAFELRFKQYLRNPPRLVTPHDRCVGEAGGGWAASSRGPQTRTGKGGLLFPHSSSEKGREGNNLSASASCYS